MQRVYYGWDWDGDGRVDEWMGSYSTGQEITTSHTWAVGGVYEIKVKAKDIKYSESRWSDPLTVVIEGNSPPDKPSIDGPSTGKKGESLRYSVSATDPNGDMLFYMFDWNGEQSDWIGPYRSGDTAYASHLWRGQGNYEVKVKAKDSYGEEGEWSEPLEISISLAFTSSLSENYLHIFGKGIMPLGITVVLGDLPFEICAPGASRVDFYLDDEFRGSDGQAPFRYIFDDRAFGFHTIKTEVHYTYGKIFSEEIKVCMVHL